MTNSAQMFLRPHQRNKDGKEHTYWSLVETVRTVDGPRQKTLCYFGELNGSAQARWLPKTGSWTFSKTPLNQHKHWLNHHPRKMSCQKQQRSVYRGTKLAEKLSPRLENRETRGTRCVRYCHHKAYQCCDIAMVSSKWCA